MRVVELFSGTGTLSRIARERGHQTFTVDLHEPADHNGDVLHLSAHDIYFLTAWPVVDVIWASPPCDGFSVASIGRMWGRDEFGAPHPKHPTSEVGVRLLRRTLSLIFKFQPTVWFIENPRGMMRRQPELLGLKRHTVTYCQYGDTRMKPTDIWTNSTAWTPRPMCRPRGDCHESAPRGAKTGTQGVKGKKNRARLPEELCVEVLEAAEKQVNA